ncbi:heme-binding protein [Castellaniella sp.]|uniref:GlcG/HbpS family heme-binding protein n=1 Tax=Castellaniella sp. TaxID=1955812 RepID=UPI002AFE9417|nr:heme-binding protein [Castellaniella sp.]
MKMTRVLTQEDSRRMAAAAEAEARKNGWNVSIAICDAGGHPLWLQRMDGAAAISALVAPGKARTSAIGGKPSKVYEDMVNQGRTAAMSMPITPMEGGEPILHDQQVIGAIGVSGVKASQDAQIARAGIAALDEPHTGSPA